jgi:predicted permease
MKRIQTIWSRIRSLWQRRAVHRDIDEELQFHLERRTAENIASGMSPRDAEREARRRFGNLQSLREECRDARGVLLGEAWLRDLKFAFRTLLKSPAFTIVAALMLAVGIGSVTTIFGAIRATIFKPYSSPNGDRLVHLWSDEVKALSVPDYLDIRAQATSFAEMGLYVPVNVNLGGEHPTAVHGVNCTPGALRVYSVAPLLGRWLDDADENPGASRVVVISHRLWKDSLGGNPDLIGKTIRLEDADVTVVGVMPADFEFSWLWMDNKICDVWCPLQLRRETPGNWNWCAIACLKPGVTLGAADSEIKTIGARLKAARGDAEEKYPYLVTSLRDELARYTKSYAWMILGATLLVLAVACANVGSMLLARGLRRRGEIGVRVALGASPGMIFRLAFSESLLIAVAGTIGGIMLAPVELAFLRSFAPPDHPRTAAISLDGHALIFAAGLCLLTALLAGFPAALAALRISANDLLRTDNRGAAGSATRHRLLRGLVVTQVAVAFILANVAVLLSASYSKMVTSNSRLAKDYVLTAELNLHSARYTTNNALTRFCEQLSERAAAIPGVVSASTSSDLPLEWGPGLNVLANDEIYDPKVQRPAVVHTFVTPNYFAAADIPMLHGETLKRSDAGWGNIGIVVNRAFADKYWPGQNPLGKIVRPNSPQASYHAHVVGVVENVRQWGPASQPQPQVYFTIDHFWGNTIFLVVRSTKPAAALAPALRRAVAELDPDLPLSNIRTFKDVLRHATLIERVTTVMANGCTVAAILMAAIGLYGTLSYHVQQRTREMGVRIALGADRGNLIRLVFRQGMVWVLPGIILGIIGALASAKGLRTCVYDVNTISPAALVLSTSTVFFAAGLACLIPAYRAAKVEPMEALRCE